MDIDPLTELTIQLSKSDLDYIDRLTWICRSVARVVPKATRISLWRFSNDFETRQCICLLVNNEVLDPSGKTLRRAQSPDYFDAILRDDTVNASNARHHPDTRGFTDTYFKPNDVYSLLDYIFHRDFTPFGVICCEATQAPVEWQERDVMLLKRVAGIVSMFY